MNTNVGLRCTQPFAGTKIAPFRYRNLSGKKEGNREPPVLWHPRKRLNNLMQVGSRLITNVETQYSVAALTFDDGPHPIYTPRILKVLANHRVRATFFMVGAAARRYPEIVRDVATGGHVIGNHSWSHSHLPKIPSRFRRLKELWDCANATAPYGQKLFRPPFGAQDDRVRLDALLLRYKVILWNGSAQDWVSQQSEEIAQKMIDRVRPGSIFLLHDAIYDSRSQEPGNDRESMLHGLDKALSVLKKNIHFVTVPELLRSGQPVCHWPRPLE